MRAAFRPLLRRVRLGLLRTDVSEDEMVEWPAEVPARYLPRVDLANEPPRRKVRHFVLRTPSGLTNLRPAGDILAAR